MLTKKEYKQIRARLLAADVTLADLARKFHKSRETIYKAVRRQNDSDTSKQIRAYIETLIGSC